MLNSLSLFLGSWRLLSFLLQNNVFILIPAAFHHLNFKFVRSRDALPKQSEISFSSSGIRKQISFSKLVSLCRCMSRQPASPLVSSSTCIEHKGKRRRPKKKQLKQNYSSRQCALFYQLPGRESGAFLNLNKMQI
jgi:hypothetical protein